jgi:hypothetical protein
VRVVEKGGIKAGFDIIPSPAMQSQNGFFALSAIPAVLINSPLMGVISHPPEPLIDNS